MTTYALISSLSAHLRWRHPARGDGPATPARARQARAGRSVRTCAKVEAADSLKRLVEFKSAWVKT